MPAVADKTDREGIMKMEQTGRLTLPTDADVVAETLRLKNLLGADALRDCDGTEMPKELLTDPAKKYATYYTTRKDNAWAEANPDEVQQEYLISDRHTARGTKLRIHLMDGFHTQRLGSLTARRARSSPPTNGSSTSRRVRSKLRRFPITSTPSAFWRS